MDENRLLELPQESFRPMIAQSVQLEQFLGEELIFCFRDLDGVHTFTTCYGDIYKTVNALRDYVRLLESVCDQWELTGFHRATYARTHIPSYFAVSVFPHRYSPSG